MSWQETIINRLDNLLGIQHLSKKEFLKKKSTFIWSVVAFFCIDGMTLLAFLLDISVVFHYGLVLILLYILYIPSIVLFHNFDRIGYVFLLLVILITSGTIALLGGIANSLGLTLVGLSCAFASVLYNNVSWTVQLFAIYALSIIVIALLQPYLNFYVEIPASVNLLFNVLNILWITGSTLMFILSYIKQQTNIEEMESSRLKELDEAKTRLYTNITHEFRTPLTIILGMVDLIEKTPGKWMDKGINEIRLKSKKLLLMVNQMLNLAQLESGLFTKNMVQGDIVNYLKYLTESFSSSAESRKIELRFITRVNEYKIDFDPGKLMHIISNLLSNALKFTPENGSIHVKAGPEHQADGKEYFNIEVSDTGPGIPREDLEHIFDRFYRGNTENAMSFAGSGLGLAYTRELVNMLGGRIWVQSKPGEGTTFRIVFPVSREATSAQPGDFEIEDDFLPYFDTYEKPVKTVSKTIARSSDRPLLLIVEDNPEVINYLIEILDNRYRIEVAGNGKEGFDIACRIIPDIVISDVMMPVMDGFEFLESLRKDFRTSHIPVVLLTARADDISRLHGLSRGADAYLSKPFREEELFIRLEKLIEVRRNIQRYIKDFPQKKELSDAPDLSMEIEFMQKINDIIEKNLHDENFGIDVLCREIPMSRTQLYRKFSALTNQTVSKFIRNIRLRKAKDLLIHQNLEVSEAAYRVGFKNLSHFSNAFKKEFGMNPSKIDEKITK